MKRFFLLVLTLALLTITPISSHAANYILNKVGDGVYAALAQPGSKTNSNALIIIGRSQVIIAGAHFIAEGIIELSREVEKLTPLPIRSVILTHHHKGYSFVDFDFPANIEIIMSWQTWQAMKSERRDLRNSISFFKTGLTLIRDNISIVLSNTERGHTSGDVLLFLPSSGILFTSDLAYNEAVGFMGDSSMRDWIVNLDIMEEFGATTIVPGIGKPGSSSIIAEFREFFRDFLTEVIRLKTAGRSLVQAKKEFSLPAKYKKWLGYSTFITANLEKAYSDQEIR